MEIVENEKFSVGLHPLVTVSICDHYTRQTVGGTKISSSYPVIGLVFGERGISNPSVMDATDAIFSVVNGAIELNQQKIAKKIELWTAVYSTQCFLGWYTFGSELYESHLHINNMFKTFTNNPLLILMNQIINHNSEELPLKIYHSNDFGSLVEVAYHLESSAIEKISIDFVNKSIPLYGLTKTEVYNQSVITSLKSLLKKIDVLIDGLEKYKLGQIHISNAELRKIATICNDITSDRASFTSLLDVDLTSTSNLDLQESFNDDLIDTVLISLLAIANSNLSTLQDLHNIHKNIAHKFDNMGNLR